MLLVLVDDLDAPVDDDEEAVALGPLLHDRVAGRVACDQHPGCEPIELGCADAGEEREPGQPIALGQGAVDGLVDIDTLGEPAPEVAGIQAEQAGGYLGYD